MLVSINMQKQAPHPFALFNLGFRPFFLGGAVFALISIFAWLGFINHWFVDQQVMTSTVVSLSQWHAHEMLYGYTMAIIAGFLLTAVKNWTGIQTCRGWSLVILFTCWLVARLLNLVPSNWMQASAVFDMLFNFGLIAAVLSPIVRAKLWAQLAVVVKVLLLTMGNLLFYLQVFEVVAQGALFSQILALVLILSLIMMIGRRVVPFFIERGVGYAVQLKQNKSVDISIMLLFVGWLISLLFRLSDGAAIICAAIFLLNGYRLLGWHTQGIWQKPLLWSLYVSLWLINFGFLLCALQSLVNIPPTWLLHFFTIGGIGLITLAMMSRVSLGHTGRNIHQPPILIQVAFMLIVLSLVFRFFLPLFAAEYYVWWVNVSGAFWIAAFAIFVYAYAAMLIKSRADGMDG